MTPRAHRRLPVIGAMLALLQVAGTPACATVEVATESVKTVPVETRGPVDPAVPIVSTSWQQDDSGFTGKIAWASCDIESHWTTTETRVTRTTPKRELGIGLAVSGLALGLLAGSQAVNFEEKNCEGRVIFPEEEPCHYEKSYNAVAIATVLVGIGVSIAGVATISRSARLEEEILQKKKESRRSREACITRADLKELSLVVKVGPQKFLPVRVFPNGVARIEVHERSDLPLGVDLPIAVYRVPQGARGLLQRGQVVGVIRFEDARAAAPPE